MFGNTILVVMPSKCLFCLYTLPTIALTNGMCGDCYIPDEVCARIARIRNAVQDGTMSARIGGDTSTMIGSIDILGLLRSIERRDTSYKILGDLDVLIH